MPTRNTNLTPEQDAFVEKVVEHGEYQNASEAIHDAVRALQHRRREDALKLLDRLRADGLTGRLRQMFRAPATWCRSNLFGLTNRAFTPHIIADRDLA
jgi:putative addiction module CopG family antidote